MKILDELERLADGATPGPWEYRSYQCDETGRTVQESGVYSNAKAIDLHKDWCVCFDARDCDEEFIAAANPETIKGLIAVVRAAKEVECFFEEWLPASHGSKGHDLLNKMYLTLSKLGEGEDD